MEHVIRPAPPTFRFGELEAVLADINMIPSRHRTAFQARLKDIQRQGLLQMDSLPRGKAAAYGLRELALMAVAIEMCQLGLSTKRAVEVMSADQLPLWMSIGLASTAILADPYVFKEGFNPDWQDSDDTDPLSMFLYFDPSVLAPWHEPGDGSEGQDIASSTFFYAGAGIVRDSLSRWTTGPTRRLALINITKLIFDIAAYLGGEEKGAVVIDQFAEVAAKYIRHGDFEADDWILGMARTYAMLIAAAPPLNQEKWVGFGDFQPAEPSHAQYLSEIRSGEERNDRTILLPGQRELLLDGMLIPTADIPQWAINSRVEMVATRTRFKFDDRMKWAAVYVPSEKFLADAVALDHKLIARAFEQNVILVTPMLLDKLLNDVAAAWAEHRSKFPDLYEEGSEEGGNGDS